MIGTCRPLGVGLYTIEGAVTISFSMRQTWKFKYGMLGGKTVVKVNRDNVRLYLKKEDFERDWEIIEKAEGLTMTNDEAQEILIDMRLEEDLPGIYTYSDRQNTAFWMACRALKICKDNGYVDYQDFLEV